MSSVQLGVIAEDDTDCKTMRVLIQRILDPSVKVHKWSGRGCGRVRTKLNGRAKAMKRKGCGGLILLHDLDLDPVSNELNDVNELRYQLESSISEIEIPKCICIPREELEAWFWADDALIKQIGRGKGSAHPSPHNVRRPKEALMRLSQSAGGKPRYSTNDNPVLAAALDLHVCIDKCPAFSDLHDFVSGFQ